MDHHIAYVGMDVHKETIAVAVAPAEGGKVEYRGEIRNDRKSLERFLRRLNPTGEPMLLCYEAGPCGYALQRQIAATGLDCWVVAPSKIPKRAGDRIKTDRRDAEKLAKLLRAGELVPVWVPDEETEAVRDLTRARADLKSLEVKVRQRLGAFLLRHGRKYPGKSKWTKSHFRWLSEQRFEQEASQAAFEEYVRAVRDAKARVADLDTELARILESWSLKPVVQALMALRGINRTAATILASELGDIGRFDKPTQLMAFLGLVPSEDSSGTRKRRGSITKTGNGHARRILIEAAWSYRFPARQTTHLIRKAQHASPRSREIAWRAQKRLHYRYNRLLRNGKNHQQAITAVARELVGFIWDIAREIDYSNLTAKAA